MRKIISILILLSIFIPKDALCLRPIAARYGSINMLPKERLELIGAVEWLSNPPKTNYTSGAMFVSRYCNMRCAHCSPEVKLLPKEKKAKLPHLFISEKLADDVIVFLNDANIRELTVTGGGEPMVDIVSVKVLRMLIKQLRLDKPKKYARPGPFARLFSMPTNNTLVIVSNGLWAKKRSRRAAVLKVMDKALAKSDFDTVQFTFSVDEFHSPVALDGVASLIAMHMETDGRILHNADVSIGLKIVNGNAAYNMERIRELIEKVRKKLKKKSKKSKEVLRVDIGRLENDLHGDAYKWLGYVSGNILLKYKRKKKSSKVLVKYGIIPFSNMSTDTTPDSELPAHLMQKAKQRVVGVARNGLQTLIDTDGNACLDCRNRLDSLAFVSGHVTEGFKIVSGREARDPIFRAMREHGPSFVLDILREIVPTVPFRRYANADPAYALDEILMDEDLRMKLCFAILRDSKYAGTLYPESQQKVDALEKAFNA
ncbi:4Fe-4S cluster-binding domain-containing protein, partial [Candidatus Omnitrophota bacterium]